MSGCSQPVALATGALPENAAIEGLEALQDNARRLVRDAKIMLHARRYASAAHLAVEALGEFTRAPLLLELASTTDAHEAARLWTCFRQPVGQFPWAIFMEGAAAEEGASVDFGLLLSFIDEIGLRAECAAGNVWLRPGNLITQQMARQLVELAQTLAGAPPDPRAMQLWLKTVANARDADDYTVLARFKAALVREGLPDTAAMVERYRARLPATERAA